MNEREAVRAILADADAVLVGAGAGLSTSAGFTYSGARFKKYFADFEEKYAFHDMYSGGFYPYTSLEEHWAYWARYIMINRYMAPPIPVYEEVFRLVGKKDYFVITTNVDHCFQKAGFDKARLFYTQGDYGLFQCSGPCHQKSYDNERQVRAMWESQGMDETQSLDKGSNRRSMRIPAGLLPRCPKCGKPMSMNLRSDDSFVEDDGWHEAAGRYQDFLNGHVNGNIVFLELGVGGNTPGIIKYPFWKMTYANPRAKYICVNKGEALIPAEIEKQGIYVDDDIYAFLKSL